MYMGVWCGRRPAAAAGKAERKEEVRPRGAKKRAKDRVRKRERERANAVESARSRLAAMIRTTIFYLFQIAKAVCRYQKLKCHRGTESRNERRTNYLTAPPSCSPHSAESAHTC